MLMVWTRTSPSTSTGVERGREEEWLASIMITVYHIRKLFAWAGSTFFRGRQPYDITQLSGYGLTACNDWTFSPAPWPSQDGPSRWQPMALWTRGPEGPGGSLRVSGLDRSPAGWTLRTEPEVSGLIHRPVPLRPWRVLAVARVLAAFLLAWTWAWEISAIQSM